MDREKVIKHFEECLKKIEPVDWWVNVKKEIISDAIAMLKEQDAVEPIPPTDESDLWRCGNCNHQLFRCTHQRYCEMCGQSVKWGMKDRETVIEALKYMISGDCTETQFDFTDDIEAAIALLEEQEKEIKALRLLVEWAEECDFGFDQFPEEYERYKDEITDMKYIEGMIHVAKRTLEDHGAFET